METVLTLGAELWTERDHRYRLEALLKEKGLISSDELEKFALDEDASATRDVALAAYVKRIFDPLKRTAFDAEKD